MGRLAIRHVLLALALVLAGCGEFLGASGENEGTTPTVTEEPTTDTAARTPVQTETTTATAEEPMTTSETTTQSMTTEAVDDATETTAVDEVAPGVTTAGVADPFALASAHENTLDDTSYTVQRITTERYENGTLRSRESVTGRFPANGSGYLVTVNETSGNADGASMEQQFFADGDRVLAAQTTLNGTQRYFVPTGPNAEPYTPREWLFFEPTFSDRLIALFGSANVTVESDEGPDGTYQLTVDEFTTPAALTPADDAGVVTNATLNATVTDSGLVRKYNVAYIMSDDEPIRVNRSVRYTEVGNTTVERPSWYDAASANATVGTDTESG
jgi:hypothetical protein